MIFTERTITIRNDSSSMNAPVILYRGDKNVEVRFTLVESPYKYSNRDSINIIESTDASYAQLVIKTPNDRDPIFGDITAVGQSNVTFVIGYDMIDEIEEVGTYDFQIRLFDADQTSMATIPEVVSGFIIKEPIAKEDNNNNITNSAIVGSAVVTNDTSIPTFVGGSYNKTAWHDGDVISRQKLNKIEDVIYETYELSKDSRKTSQSITMADLSTDVKEAMTGGSVAIVGKNMVGRENVKNRSIDDRKLLDSEPIKNLFNKNTVTYGGYIDPANGNFIEGELPEGVSQTASDYIPVVPNANYCATHVSYCAFYDSDHVFISGLNTFTNPFTTPSNASFVRFSVRQERLHEYMVMKGDKLSDYDEYYYKQNNLKIDYDKVIIKDKDIEATKIKNIIRITSKNLFNKATAQLGYYIDYLTGKLTEGSPNSNTYYASDYILIDSSKQYVASHRGYSACYDENKMFLQGFTETSFNFPVNAKYFRVSINSVNIDSYQLEEGDISSSYEDFSQYYIFNNLKIHKDNIIDYDYVEHYWNGKTFNIIGDSITYGLLNSSGETVAKRFSTIIANTLKMKHNNYGISSSTIAINPNDAGRNPMVKRYSTMSDDADLIIVAGGTNDWNYSWSPIGDMNSRDNETFYGALHNLCLGLIEKYPKKQLLFMTPIKRGNDVNHKNNHGKTLKDYCDIIKEVCEYYSIPVLDMYSESGLNPHIVSQATAYFDDVLTHPNQDGHEIMANRIIGFLMQLR